MRAKSGQRYLVTAAHLYRSDEWPTMRSISLSSMDGKRTAACQGVPQYIGLMTEKSKTVDFSQDLMIAPLSDEGTSLPLKLASTMPAMGETVWAVGCEERGSPEQKLYACKVLEVTAKWFSYEQVTPFDPWDFSGGPVVDRHGNVVGNLLAGTKQRLIGTTAPVMRERLAALKIDLD